LIRRHTGLTNGEIGKIFKMKAQAVSKAGINLERLMKKNRKIRSQVNKLISIFEGRPLSFLSFLLYCSLVLCYVQMSSVFEKGHLHESRVLNLIQYH
jgi:hypothetical protein